VFGYITVLPGAFSAYRYIALQNDVSGQGPLQKYFLGETMVRTQAPVYPLTDFVQHGAGADIFTANMYLAEDRVCLIFYNPLPLFLTDSPDSVLGARI
jgi:chitin synthase